MSIGTRPTTLGDHHSAEPRAPGRLLRQEGQGTLGPMPSPCRPTRRTVGRMLVLPIAVLSLATAAVSVGIRLAPDDPAKWHQDPLTAPAPQTPNWYRISPQPCGFTGSANREGEAPVFDMPPADLAAAFDAVALADSRVEVLAGSADQGFVTYLQRSALMGYPDYVSVRFISTDEGGSTLAVLSRARYGSGDLGVNQKRVERWVQQTTQRLG